LKLKAAELKSVIESIIDRSVQIRGKRGDLWRIRRDDGLSPFGCKRVADDELLKGILCDADLLRRQQKIAFAICKLGLYLSLFEWCGRACIDLCRDLTKVLTCQLDISLAILLVAEGEYEIPVCTLHISDRVRRLK